MSVGKGGMALSKFIYLNATLWPTPLTSSDPLLPGPPRDPLDFPHLPDPQTRSPGAAGDICTTSAHTSMYPAFSGSPAQLLFPKSQPPQAEWGHFTPPYFCFRCALCQECLCSETSVILLPTFQ